MACLFHQNKTTLPAATIPVLPLQATKTSFATDLQISLAQLSTSEEIVNFPLLVWEWFLNHHPLEVEHTLQTPQFVAELEKSCGYYDYKTLLITPLLMLGQKKARRLAACFCQNVSDFELGITLLEATTDSQSEFLDQYLTLWEKQATHLSQAVAYRFLNGFNQFFDAVDPSIDWEKPPHEQFWQRFIQLLQNNPSLKTIFWQYRWPSPLPQPVFLASAFTPQDFFKIIGEHINSAIIELLPFMPEDAYQIIAQRLTLVTKPTKQLTTDEKLQLSSALEPLLSAPAQAKEKMSQTLALTSVLRTGDFIDVDLLKLQNLLNFGTVVGWGTYYSPALVFQRMPAETQLAFLKQLNNPNIQTFQSHHELIDDLLKNLKPELCQEQTIWTETQKELENVLKFGKSKAAKTERALTLSNFCFQGQRKKEGEAFLKTGLELIIDFMSDATYLATVERYRHSIEKIRVAPFLPGTFTGETVQKIRQQLDVPSETTRSKAYDNLLFWNLALRANDEQLLQTMWPEIYQEYRRVDYNSYLLYPSFPQHTLPPSLPVKMLIDFEKEPVRPVRDKLKEEFWRQNSHRFTNQQKKDLLNWCWQNKPLNSRNSIADLEFLFQIDVPHSDSIALAKKILALPKDNHTTPRKVLALRYLAGLRGKSKLS